jgi:hypothetical protein
MGLLRGFLILAISSFTAFSQGQQDSQVYTCHFQDDLRGASTVRMKKYFSATENMNLGKVDLLTNQEVTDSIATKVYEFPLWDSQDFVQIWNAKDLRLDAQLSLSQGKKEFAATLTRNQSQFRLLCSEL